MTAYLFKQLKLNNMHYKGYKIYVSIGVNKVDNTVALRKPITDDIQKYLEMFASIPNNVTFVHMDKHDASHFYRIIDTCINIAQEKITFTIEFI